MNSTQINCFLAAAETLNFTKAAEKLYMTQSVLSRQISGLEHELGFSLFAREHNAVTLTKAGEIFLNGMLKLTEDYARVYAEALNTSQGTEGTLVIGTAEGQMLGEFYDKVFVRLWRDYPNLKIQVSYYPLSQLTRALMDGSVDVAIMSKIEAVDIPNISMIDTRSDLGWLVIPADHPMANKENLTFEDFSNDVFIIVSESESERINAAQKRTIESGGFKGLIKIAPTVGTMSHWIDTGVGISSINAWHTLRYNSRVKFVRVPGLGVVDEVAAWRNDNHNSGINTLVQLIRDKLEA